jgi:hypothetical protein
VELGQPSGQQGLTGRGQPLHPVERGPQLGRGRTGHHVRVQPVDDAGQPVTNLDHHRFEHAYDDTGAD